MTLSSGDELADFVGSDFGCFKCQSVSNGRELRYG